MKLVYLRAVILTALSGLLSSCVQMDNTSNEVGYLSFSMISIDYKIENIIPTKASVPASDLPEVDDFTVRITGTSLEEPMVFEAGKLPEDKIALPIGTYMVEAIYGSNNFDAPYFYATEDVILAPLQETVVSFTDVPLGNAMLTVTLPSDFSQHMTLSALRLSDGAETVTINAGEYVYVPSGRSVSATFVGTNSVGETKEINVALGVLEPQHAYDIVCNLSLPSIVLPDQSAGAWATRLYVNPATVSSGVSDEHIVYEVIDGASTDWSDVLASSEVIEGNYHVVKGLENGKSYKVRARLGNVVSNEVPFTVDEFKDGATYKVEHAYDSNSYLTGTTVTADLKLTGILKTLHDAGLIQTTVSLKNGSQVYRTTNAISGTLSGSDTWPYVPKGTSYSLEVSHKVQGDSDIVSSIVPSVTVPAPKISVDVSAYTTYDWYIAGNSTNANNYDKRLLVENRKATLKISNAILQNTKYAYLLTSSSVTYAGSSLTAFSVSASASNALTYDNVTYTDSQWGSYSMKASVTFDGVSANDEHVCWITGLPYSYNFVDGSLDQYRNDGWTTNGTLRVSDETLLNRANTLVLQHYRRIFGTTNEKGFVVSPKFQIPSNVSVQPLILRSSYRSSGDTERTGYVGAVANTTTSNTSSITYKTSGGSSTSGTIYGENVWMDSFVLSNTVPYISIDCDTWNSGSGGVYYFLHEAHFRYAQ